MSAQPVQQDIAVGIEVECFVTQLRRDLFTRALNDIGCDYTGDGSICPPSSHTGIEVRTPPLSYTLFEQNFLPKLTKVFKEYNTRTNASCGLHVHASHPKFFIRKYLKRINLTWIAMEDVFFAFQNPRRMYNSFCVRKWYDYVERGGLPKFGKTRTSLIRGLNFRRDALNFDALRKHGTIECRLHNGTANPTAIRNWVYLLNQFYNYCFKHYRIKDVKELMKMRCSTKKVKRVWQLLELDGKVKRHFESRIQPQLFPRLNKQVTTARHVLPFVYKLKWYQSKYGFDQMSYNNLYIPSGIGEIGRETVSSPRRARLSIMGKDVTDTRSYKNFIKLGRKKDSLLRKMVTPDE